MKTLLPLLILVILSFSSCSHEKHYPNTDIILNGKALLRIQFENIHDTSNYVLYHYTILPTSCNTERFMVYSDTLLEFEIKATQPTIIYLNDNVSTQFMTLPNDTLDVIINRKTNSSITERISFKGQTATISEYLNKDKLFLYDCTPRKEELPEHFNSRMDSVYSLAIKKINDFNNQKELPEWFIEFENTEIFCACEAQKRIQYFIRHTKYNQFIETKPVQKAAFQEKEIQFNWLSFDVLQYLSSISPYKYDTLLTPQHSTTDVFCSYTRDNIKALRGKLTDEMMSYFVATKLTNALNREIKYNNSKAEFAEAYKMVDSLFIEMSPLITDTILQKYIQQYKESEYQKYLNQNNLQKGKKAPTFYLENIDGSNVKLSDFKGKLICLNFWGTYCTPCIKSIPQKNELVQKFSKMVLF